jgi:epsilon-lactone hydrolase
MMPSREAERACETWRGLPPAAPDATIEDLRAAYAEFVVTHCVPEDDVTTTEITADRLSALWVRTPAASEDRTVLYLHGGGYSLGSARVYRGLTWIGE